jgi:hypothetical protein
MWLGPQPSARRKRSLSVGQKSFALTEPECSGPFT